MSTNSILLTTTDVRGESPRERRRLGPRLLLSILVFSSIVTLFATIVQLYLEYSRDLSEMNSRLEQIERSYLNSIALSLWIVDDEQLRIQLNGILALPDIRYLEVTSRGERLMRVGEAGTDRLLERDYRLSYRYRGDLLNLGTLRVGVDLEGVYNRLRDRVLVIFATQAIKTFLVAGFIIFIFQFMVTRHLQQISSHVRGLTLGQTNPELALARKRAAGAPPDELDDVVDALNRMCRHLAASYRRVAESEERFDLAMRGTNDGLWDWSLDDDTVYYSPRCAEILGMRPEQIGTHPGAWQDQLHLEDRAHFRQSMVDHLAGRTPHFECVFRMANPLGRVRWVWSRGQGLRRATGHVYRMVGTHRDITVQKENEAALAAANHRLHEEQKRRAEAQQLACIGELSASIAHEIRNPLASIVNSLELLGHDDQPPEERHSVIDIVNSETRQLQRILNDFLEFARLRPSQQAEHDLIETLSDAVVALGMAIHCESVELFFEPHGDSCIAYYDADQLRQVVWNLALNALQAMPNGGRLHIRTSVQDERVVVRIADNGCGIAEDMLNEVTRPFVTSREEGTGLGLSVVIRILEQHGSRLTISSEPKQGTEVCFSLETRG